ncbi:MAG: hypothetical protein LBR99_05810 [Treponema sp.]|jgi:hypothetical protein|nr:hypothetical protein [Treponema sp.]
MLGKSVQKFRVMSIILGFSLFLGACGDLGMVLPSQGTYQVNALVDGDYTLDEYSVINQNSKICPFFMNSVVNDPDVRGLTVFVQNLSGAVVSRKVRYVLSQESSADTQEETLRETNPQGTSGEASQDTGEYSPADEPGSDTGDGSENDSYPEDSPEGLTENTPETESPPPLEDPGIPEIDNADAAALVEAEADAAEPETPAETDIPAETSSPSAAQAETGVSPSDKTDTAAAATQVKENPVNSPVKSPSGVSTSEVLEDQVLPVKQLDQYLPAFRIFENLGIGRYNLVFQVLGDKEILYRTSKAIYFLADADFTLGDIQSYLPGIPSGGRLIPSGINVVLETEISADTRLDPYVIWYSGKKTIAQGRSSEGANYLLWKTPDQTGFHTVKAKVFPLLPEEKVPNNIIGKTKELSLAISLKTERMRYFDDSSKDFISWYQFWGNLDDAKSPGNSERQLIPRLSQKPRWFPYAGIYGLFVGPDDSYILPGKPFSLSEKEQGTGRIFFHFAPLAEGTVLNAAFNSRDGLSGAAVLDLFLGKEDLTLRLSSKDDSEEVPREETVVLNLIETEVFITAVVDFEITPDHLSATLSLENPVRKSEPAALPLTNPINGEGRVLFGGTGQSSGYKRNTKWPVLDKTGNPGNGTAIFSELALSYARIPLPENEDELEPETDPETGLVSARQQEPLGETSQPVL